MGGAEFAPPIITSASEPSIDPIDDLSISMTQDEWVIPPSPLRPDEIRVSH